jgi:hypothetical protein
MSDESRNSEGARDDSKGSVEAAEEGGETGVRETGDLTGATTTHAGAGGVMENNGGAGTAPTKG